MLARLPAAGGPVPGRSCTGRTPVKITRTKKINQTKKICLFYNDFFRAALIQSVTGKILIPDWILTLDGLRKITAAALNSFLKNLKLKPGRAAAASEPNVAAGRSAGAFLPPDLHRTDGSCLNLRKVIPV